MVGTVAVAKEADRKQEFSPTNTVIHHVRDEHEMQLSSLGGFIGNIRRDGGTSSVESIATQLSGVSTAQRASALLALQQTHGNRYVQRLVTGIQTKLKIGQIGDIYEQEAERVAEQVMRMPEPSVQRQMEEEKSPRAKEFPGPTHVENRNRRLLLQHRSTIEHETPYSLIQREQIRAMPGSNCNYIIHAGTPSSRRCEGSTSCGMVIFVPYVRISASGRCLPFEEQQLTENVSEEQLQPGEVLCPISLVITGGECSIGPNGYLSGCVDEYALCGGIDRYPLGTCTRRYFQQYLIGDRTGTYRRVIAENHLVFRINRRNELISTVNESRYRRHCSPEFDLSGFDQRIQFPTD